MVKLGRYVNHDPRSRNFAFQPRTLAVPKSMTHILAKTVLNQGDIGSCTGNASAQCYNSNMFKPVRKSVNSGKLLTEQDAIKIYSLGTRLDDVAGTYPPDDTGCSGLGVAKAAKQLGYIDRYTHTFSFDAFCQALQEQPVIVGTSWTNAMFSPQNTSGLLLPGPINSNTIVGGHEYLAYGIDYTNKILRFRNSWGKDWGNDGNFVMTFRDFALLLQAEGDATVLHGVGLS